MPGFIHEIAESFDLPEEALGAMRLTLTGSGRVLVENRGAIVEYGESSIQLARGKARLRISGEGLCLRAMDAGELLITGRVREIELE